MFCVPCGHEGFTPPGVWVAYRCCLYPYGSQARLRLKLPARGRGPGAAAPRPPTTPCPRRRRPIAAQAKQAVPAGHTKPHPYDKPRSTKNGAAEFTRRAVARALQEGTRARTSGGAARRGSDVGGRQPDPGSPRLPDVRARRLLTQWSRRADVRGCRHEMDFRVMSRRTSLLCRECTLLVLDRNKRRCSTRR